jgi:hypothetical protein
LDLMQTPKLSSTQLVNHTQAREETQLQTLTRMDMVVIGDDHHHMTTINENINSMTLAHLSSICSLDLSAPFCTSTSTSKLLILY